MPRRTPGAARQLFVLSFRSIAVLFIAFIFVTPASFAAGKRAPQPAPIHGKKVIALAPVARVQIEMPDGSFHDFGSDFQASMTTQLFKSGRYVVSDLPHVMPRDQAQSALGLMARKPGYEWPGSVVPAATVRVQVEAMSFQTGSRGERMFYGFNERFRTPYNSGSNDYPNEFPLQAQALDGESSQSAGPSWFGNSFDQLGGAVFGSRAGLDLGDGFSLDALFAYLKVKYASYRSELHLRIDIEAPLAGRNEYRLVQVYGHGFFFDVAGGYDRYSAGIRVARRDAMGQALKKAIAAAYGAIDRAVSDLPLTARIDSVLPDGTLLIGTGPAAEVVPGTRYELVDHPAPVGPWIEINESVNVGAIARGIAGTDPESMSWIQPGMILREYRQESEQPSQMSLSALTGAQGFAALSGGPVALPIDQPQKEVPLAATESIELPPFNVPRPDLDGLVPEMSRFKAFLKSLAEILVLPYRVWRYYSYDRTYAAVADPDSEGSTPWLNRALTQRWAKKIGLTRAIQSHALPRQAIVAVIDSGIDYDHSALHSHLWLNPKPQAWDGGVALKKDRYGWDFISGDSRPYDDGYHGTEVASLIAAVSPSAKLMALKVFNPWGVTSSAALNGAFVYAVDHGAHVIVCAWATAVNSQAIREGVAYAQKKGVLVVAAAGDGGLNLRRDPVYPASLSENYDNVLTVAALDDADRLHQGRYRPSNSGASLVGLSAPGLNITAATPRGGRRQETSSAMAAALVAGAAARAVAFSNEGDRPTEWISQLREDSQQVPALVDHVRGGLSLRIRR